MANVGGTSEQAGTKTGGYRVRLSKQSRSDPRDKGREEDIMIQACRLPAVERNNCRAFYR